MLAHISWAWADMTLERIVKILTTFGDYWETRGKGPDSWGMFAVLVVSHQAGGRFGMSVEFWNPDGTCKDLSVLTEYLDRFQDCKPTSGTPGSSSVYGSPPAGNGIPVVVGATVITRHRKGFAG